MMSEMIRAERSRRAWTWGGALAALALAAACGPSSPAGERAAHGEGEGPEERGHEERDHEERGHEERGHEGHEEGVVELSEAAAKRADIRVVPVERRALLPVLETTARVGFDERRLAHVSPRVSGRVAEVLVDLGDTVEAGTLLATVDSIALGEAKADFLAAKAERSLARKTLQREERLRRDKISSEQATIEARAAADKALARWRSARETLRLLGLDDGAIDAVRYGDPSASRHPLRAPIAGRIIDQHAVVGELVSPADNAFTVADLSSVWVWLDVYERDLSRVHLGDTVEVVVLAYPERKFAGVVSYIEAQIDPDTRVARARIDVANSELMLKPGMFAQVIITDPHAVPPGGQGERLVVPATAVIRDGAERIAFVVVGARRYERRALTLGAKSGGFYEVLAGLAPSDRVVASGAFLLKSEIAKEEMGGGHDH